MLKYIDEKLDIYFDKNSPEYMNYNIWGDIFSYLDSIKESLPDEYEYELKRIRDLKNSIDYAIEEGETKRKSEIVNEMLKDGEPVEKIIQYTRLTKEQIEELKNKG